MKLGKLIDLLAPLGLAVVVGAFALLRAGKTLPGGARPWLVGGAGLILAHLLLRWEDVAKRIGQRQMRYGTNTLILVLAVVGILGLMNYVLVNFLPAQRWDLTKNRRYSLADQTKKVLAGLKEDVKITYFDRTRDLPRGQERLKDFQAGSSHVKVEFVDPIVKPAVAQASDVRGPWPMLIVEKGEVKERLGNDSEQDITNALIKVTRGRKRVACFAYGEGERDLDDSGERGYSGAKAALGRSQYETKKVLLLREKKVPEDCSLLVVPGPEKDLLPEVVEAIKAYVKGGGKALVMADPELKEAAPNIDGLLKAWNIEAGKDVVVDVSGMGQLFGAGELTPLAGEYPYHEITKDFRVATAYHMARSVEAGKGSVEGVFAQDLVKTSAESWAETDLTLKGRIAFDEKKDKKGPISLAVVATVRGPAPAPSPSPSPEGAEPPKAPEGRVVAVGDSDFASNTLLAFQGNKDFFLNTVAWLVEDTDLISIRPREPDDQRLSLSRQTQENVKWLALLVLPGFFVGAGIWSWWRRR